MIRLPRFLSRHLADSPNRQRIASNTAWLLGDQALRLVLGLAIGVWLARYLGPDRFGLLSFAIALSALFGSAASVGLENVVIRDLVRSPEKAGAILGTAFAVQAVAGALSWCLAAAAVLLFPPGQEGSTLLVVAAAGSFFFQPFNVVDYAFRARIESRYSVMGRIAPFLAVSIIKVLLILGRASLPAFAAMVAVEAGLNGAGLAAAYRFTGGSVRAWRASADLVRRLISESWPLALAGISVMVYMRIDQVMLGYMADSASVGVYSAAVRITGLWYFVPVFLVQSAYPVIVASRQEGAEVARRRLQNLFTSVALLSYAVVIPLAVFAGPIVRLLYGPAYAASASVVVIQAWAGIFVGLGTVQSAWFVSEGLTLLSLRRVLLGAAANVGLNLWLIPAYGIRGAAAATVASYMLAAFLSNLTSRVTRPVFLMQARALFGVFEKTA